MNVFAVPGEVFSEVKASPGTPMNWLVPAILAAIVGVISVIIIFSQPNIQQQFREQFAKVWEQQVKAGTMTQAQADETQNAVEKVLEPTTLKILFSIREVIFSFLRVVWWGFILWLLAKWLLKIDISFLKGMEVAGLALMISVLGAIVSLLLIVNFGKMGATPSLALAVQDFDATRKSHLFMGAANIFSFWQVGVISVGLAKLADVPFLKAAWVVFTYWVLQECFLILTGLGQMAM